MPHFVPSSLAESIKDIKNNSVVKYNKSSFLHQKGDFRTAMKKKLRLK